MTRSLWALALISTLGFSAAPPSTVSPAAGLRPVRLSFIEALDPKDTTSSKRFQEEYEAAIQKGKELTSTAIATCGHELVPSVSFYGASDPIQAKERGEVAAQAGAWMIVGPRRSNHYLLLAKGAPATPSVSLMASSEEVASLGDVHLSMAPSNTKMASAAAAESAARLGKSAQKNYIAVVSGDCLACRDFARQFDAHATALGLTKSAEIAVVGNEPDTTTLKAALEKETPAFVLLPNYSIVTSYLISVIHPLAPRAFFVGGDGWGDSKFGFVQNGRDLDNAIGFTVRGNPSMEEGLKTFVVGQSILKSGSAATFGSSTALAILRIFDSTASFLCSERPIGPDDFKAAFRRAGTKQFSAPWGTSIYNLDRGNIVYLKSTGAL